MDKTLIPSSQEQKLSSEILSLDEVAKTLNISRCTAWRWARQGAFPTFRLGKLIRVKASDLEDFIEKNRVIY